MPDDFTILHISDLHIESSKAKTFDRSVVLDPLIKRVKEDAEEGLAPEIIAVTGDIAFKGVKEEYALAKDFFKELLDAVGLSYKSLYIVPGNHDVNRKKYRPGDIPRYDDMQKLDEELMHYRDDLLKGMREYFTFAGELCPHLEPVEMDLAPFANIHEIKNGGKVGLVGLNSAWMCRQLPEDQEDRFQIAVGRYQMEQAMKALEEKGPADANICLFHHPLSWLWSRDSRLCINRLNQFFVLSGHLHEADGSFANTYDGQLFSFQAGAAYYSTQFPNRFQYITLDWGSKKVRLDFRKYVSERGIWSLDADTGDDGKKNFDVPFWEKDAPEPACPAHALEIPQSYLAWIKDKCVYVDADRLQADGDAVPIELMDIFIPLFCQTPKYITEKQGDEIERDETFDQRKMEPEFIADTLGKITKRYWAVEKLVSAMPHMLLEGQPGSGKTTLFKHAAYCMANEECPYPWFRDLCGRLPVLVFLTRLSTFLQKCDPAEPLSVQAILEHYFSHMEKVLDYSVIEQFSAAGKAVFLLDGLDEIPEASRKPVIEAFSNFSHTHPGIKLVWSGRPHGLRGEALNPFRRYHVQIEPLNWEQIQEFIQKWFAFVNLKASGMGARTAQDLIAGIRDHESISELTQSPLMLTAICLLYYNDKELPGQRAELYKKFVDNLLARRFDDPGPVMDFLSAFAWKMHEKHAKAEDQTFALNLLAQAFPALEKEAETKYRRRLEAEFHRIEPRCGLLKRDNGAYGFAHLTFQEFLCAHWLKANSLDYWKAIQPFLNDEWYKEAVELFIGLLSEDNRKWSHAIVKNILEGADREPFHKWRLAARALKDMHPKARTVDLTDLATEKMRKAIASRTLEPVPRADAGEILGRLGDRRDLEAFVRIPGGTYRFKDGQVELEEFEISQYPVANQWYKKFMKDRGYAERKYWTKQGRLWLNEEKEKQPRLWEDRQFNCPNQPVVGVCWYEAAAFCKWLTISRNDGFLYSLPTQQQWETAAAGREKREYPWGKWQDGFCNTSETEIAKTSAVGVFPQGATPEKIHDMAGNVWEWTRSRYDTREDFDGNETPVLRGGSWVGSQFNARCAGGGRDDPAGRGYGVGFRCVRTKK
ncbi:SUMF1/EgtB/PvdO family nonheme iron enzyme [Desulfatibacillum aliphaticivorans]|uniref:SUMF1/EgtB/PvdO family nonheme iron enzyme n=1 Tax=Desulfatibacillum aliphaticivorans TaxID=218208 RepID=UPI0003FA57B7|nr:SUMF1/EgtB/PvdO family nonheme iron enzyme [Desulfatibacillum aliphaticivorans]